MKYHKNPSRENWNAILERPKLSYDTTNQTVVQIFEEVKQKGDAALRKYTQQFDGVKLDTFRVSISEMEEAEKRINPELKEAIEIAYQNIYDFHAAQKTEVTKVEKNGVLCWQEKRPIQKVGLYIPGGTAPLFSTLLMLAIPAQIAGCEEIILCTPPNSSAAVSDAILYVAKRCGLTSLFKLGGVQAIAAMTFGTAEIPQVYKLFGPGNQYVTLAKLEATRYHIAIDMPAGPSELLIVADNTANPVFVASDLLSQAEHGVDSQVLLVSTSSKLIEAVSIELKKQLELLSRKEIAKQSLEHSQLILIENEALAIEFINEYAPEHYIICMKNEAKFVENVQNAGSVFIGNYTPESAGDYASGTNHTLPTNGYAKQYSGVNLDSFTKTISFQKIDQQGIQNLGKAIELMAATEGLEAHKKAVSYRLNELKNED